MPLIVVLVVVCCNQMGVYLCTERKHLNGIHIRDDHHVHDDDDDDHRFRQAMCTIKGIVSGCGGWKLWAGPWGRKRSTHSRFIMKRKTCYVCILLIFFGCAYT